MLAKQIFQPKDYLPTGDSPPDPKLLEMMAPLYKHISSRVALWKDRPDHIYPLPAPAYSGDTITFEPQQMASQFNHAHQRLSQEQLATVWELGEFDTPSQQPDFPYRWKLNDWVIKGQFYIKQTLFNNLSTAFELLYSIPDVFTESHNLVSFSNAWELLTQGVTDLLNLFVGVPWVNKSEVEPRYQYDRQVQLTSKPDMQAIVNKSVLYELDFLQMDQKDKKVSLIAKLALGAGGQLSLVERSHFQQILAVVELAARWRDDANAANTRKTENFTAELREQHQIRSRCNNWFQTQRNQFIEKIASQSEVQFRQMFEQHVAGDKDLQALYQEYQQFLRTTSRSTQIQKTPRIVEQVSRKTFPQPRRMRTRCWERRCEQYQTYYWLETERKIEVDSSHCFWVTHLFLVHYFCLTVSAMVYLRHLALDSRVGLRALFGSGTFYPQKTIDRNSGEVSPNKNISVDSWVQRIQDVCSEMKREREDFQQQPPGLFGKFCSRLCNLMYVYLGLGLCWLVLVNILLWPVLTLLVSVLALVLIITSPVWVAPVVLLYFLSTVLVYNKHIEPCPVFPLFVALSKVLLGIFLALASNLYILALLIGAFFVLVFSVLRFVSKHLVERVLYLFVLCLANTPQGDSRMVWKISGPGMGARVFKTLREEQVYVLVDSKIEQLKLKTCFQALVKQLREPAAEASNLETQLLRLGVRVDFELVRSRCSLGQQRLTEQYNNLVAKCPELSYPKPLVKFSNSQLVHVRGNCTLLVERRIQQGHAHLQQLGKQSPQEIADYLLASALGQDCLEPISETQRRVKVVTSEGASFKSVVNSIMKNAKLFGIEHTTVVAKKEEQPAPKPTTVVTGQDFVTSYRNYMYAMASLVPHTFRGSELVYSLYIVPRIKSIIQAQQSRDHPNLVDQL